MMTGRSCVASVAIVSSAMIRWIDDRITESRCSVHFAADTKPFAAGIAAVFFVHEIQERLDDIQGHREHDRRVMFSPRSRSAFASSAIAWLPVR